MTGAGGMSRIGVIGLGGIAQAVIGHAITDTGHTVSFVRNRSIPPLGRALPAGITAGLGGPTEAELQSTDLVVEAAHPAIVAQYGQWVLRHCDLMVVSAGALADAQLLESLVACAERCGTRLIVPQGALVGVDGILAQQWLTATITMTKAPHHLDPAPHGIESATVLHDGAVGPLARRFPRNVNAMVTFALASCGLDRTRAQLVCDPAAEFGRINMELTSADGSTLAISKAQPMAGVSGTEMAASILRSIDAATSGAGPGLRFA